MSDEIRARLEGAWQRSDLLFSMLPEESLLTNPIPLRHPFLFYVGHLPAFAWNQVCRGVLGRGDLHQSFDQLFERGIDPIGVDRYDGRAADEWPPLEEVLDYRDRARAALRDAIDELPARADADPLAERSRIVSVAIEHELMHHETLVYMMQQLPLGTLRRPAGLPPYQTGAGHPGGEVEVRAGGVWLGAEPEAHDFVWDNELPRHRVEVGEFRIDRTPVTTRQWLEFVEAGGYRRRELWSAEDWAWREHFGLDHPVVWQREGDRWRYRTLFDSLPLDDVADWPVFTSFAEATAYCRWRGRRLATEAELARATFTTPDGDERSFPWGEERPEHVEGNWGFRHWAPTPVGTLPETDSAWGVADLIGSGWEWTATPFAGYPGFRPTVRTYPGYSADFFDGEHYVMRGASWATPAQLVRRSFRNWFQGRYPYVFATLRTVAAATV